MMDMADIEDGAAYVLGTHFAFPPRYVAFDNDTGAWCWTGRLSLAEGFPSRESALAHLDNDVGVRGLVKSRQDVHVLKVTIKEELA